MDENLKVLTDEKNSRLSAVSAAVSGYGLAAIRGVFVLNRWHEIISFFIAAALYLASMVCYALAAHSLIKLFQ